MAKERWGAGLGKAGQSRAECSMTGSASLGLAWCLLALLGAC